MLGDTYCVASESCAFDIIGAKFLREVQPGEIISITKQGLQTRQAVQSPRSALCVFEHIYFARPDTRLGRPGDPGLPRAGWARSSPAKRRWRPTW